MLAAAAAAGALFNAQSAQAAIAVHAIVADLVASTSKVVEVRRLAVGAAVVCVARWLARWRLARWSAQQWRGGWKSARVVWRRLGLSSWLGWLGLPAGLGLPSLSPLLWRMGMAGLRLRLWLSAALWFE